MPDEKPTTPLSTEAIVHGRLDQVIGMLGGLQGQISSVAASQTDVVTRLDRIEKWKDGVEQRLSRNSERAGSESEINAKQTQELIAEREAREALAVRVNAIETKTDAQTVILKEVKNLGTKLSRNPIFIGLLVALANAVTDWLSARGGHP